MFSRLLAAITRKTYRAIEEPQENPAPPTQAPPGQGQENAHAARPEAQRAHALFDAGDYSAARDAYEHLAQTQAAPGWMVKCGYCELMLGAPDKARKSFEAALALAPHLAQAWVGLGDIAARHNRHEEALRAYDKAIALEDSQGIARNNRAQSLLALGRLEEAWRENEARFSTPGATALYPHRLALPRWDGGAGRRLLVHWEQGFGDIIQHLRFLPLAVQRIAQVGGGSCNFECPPPLLTLLQRMPGAPTIIAAGEMAPELSSFDCQAPLLSLPLLLGCRADALPSTPYLRADQPAADVLGQAWRQRDTRRLVGIAWRASSFDPQRSLTLAALLAAFAPRATELRLVSLQKDISAEERALLTLHEGIDAGANFDSFDDTAAALAAVDSVVSVDTAVAHLAGALARPTLLLLNEPAAVRWMPDVEDSPWYGSLRLLRKNANDDWEVLLRRAATLL